MHASIHRNIEFVIEYIYIYYKHAVIEKNYYRIREFLVNCLISYLSQHLHLEEGEMLNVSRIATSKICFDKIKDKRSYC